MAAKESIDEELLSMISERQQISLNELKEHYFSMGVPKEQLEKRLQSLENANLVASRSNGGILTYYILEKDSFKKVLIVEDDKNINKLMALSIGSDFDIHQIYDGKDAIEYVRKEHPNLVILDLMLPHKDGLDICQTIKTDPKLSNTVVIIVSAMDATSNRFKGIKNGADFYVKKPFDPKELNALVNIFLKKKGKRFDPLVDLPDEERLSKELERSIGESNAYLIGTLKIENLGNYASMFGESSTLVILRLVSQLIQDIIKKYNEELFAGFLNSDEFVLAGKKDKVEGAVAEVKQEFNNVLPFILQDRGFKMLDVDIESLFETKEIPKLQIKFIESNRNERLARREEVLKSRGTKSDDIGSYTYEELQKMLSSDSSAINMIISRDDSGVRIRVSKEPKGQK